MFEAPTYIALDLPSRVAAQVRTLRQRYDVQTARLPVEITIAGSSGIGVLARDQQPDRVFDLVESLGRKFLPFTTSFESMSRFPGVPVFWLKPRDRAPFDALQSALVAAGLRFESSPFSYTPHCSVSVSAMLTSAQETQLLHEAIPSEAFPLARLSLYQPVGGRASLLKAFSFSDEPHLTDALASDATYLYALVERTMRNYVEATWGAWREAETRDTLRKAAAEGRYRLIHVAGEVVGAVSVDRLATHIQLEQLYVAPEHQRRGIGTTIVRDILAEGATLKLPVRLRVLAVNPAHRLYCRLGFVVTDTTPERLFMEHRG